MKQIMTVVTELYKNRGRLFRLAVYENKAQNGGTVFGALWNFLNPGLQIFVYWFVFSIGLKVLPNKGEYSYAVWMITGVLPWMTISNAMINGTSSIHRAANIVKNMKIPLSLIPAKSVIAAAINHVYMLIILIPVLVLNKVHMNVYMLQLVYYMIGAVYFLIGFALVASAIDAIFKDFQKFLSPIIRLLFYISGVVWPLDNLDQKIQVILHLNPLAYIIEGYRGSLLYGTEFWGLPFYTVMFWGSSTIIFIVGCFLHVKLRERFIDLI